MSAIRKKEKENDMKRILKYTLCGIGLFLIGQKFVLASNTFELEQDPNWLTYKIEREDKTVRLYFMLVKDQETKELVYCLEPGVNLSSEQYAELSEWEYAKLNLTEAQKEFITKVAYYGYNYGNHQDINYYYTAQMMIWETIIPETWKIYYTDTLGGNEVDWFPNERREILELIEEDEKLPSFANQTFEWNKNSTLKLNDDNNVLTKFQIKEATADITPNNNELKITSFKEENITFQKTYEGNPLKFYVREDGQNVMRKGSLISREFSIHLKPYKLKLELQKVDEENNLIKGVEFILTAKEEIKIGENVIFGKGKEIKRIITNDKQPIILEDLLDGEYCLQEISAPKDYEAQKNPVCFRLDKKTKTQTIKIENKKKKQKLIIQKQDAESLIPLSRVHFKIFDSQNNCLFDGLTNEQGEIILENLINGTYKIVEIETLENYQLEKEPIYVTLNGEDNVKNITITNKKIEKVPNTEEHISKISRTPIYYRKKRRK